MNENNFYKKQASAKRSLSRLMAIQILYQRDFFEGKKSTEEIKKDMIENYTLNTEKNIESYRKKIDEKFLDNLLVGIALDEGKIDEEIAVFLKEGKSFSETDEVIKQILRLAAFELKFMPNVPFKVAIGEYMDIAASFFEAKKISFINATLDNFAKKFRPSAS